MTLIEGRFDKRATHRIFSEPVALDLVMDVTALVDEMLRYLEAGHWIALGYADEHLVKAFQVAHEKAIAIRERTHGATALIADSIVVDPYRAAEVAA